MTLHNRTLALSALLGALGALPAQAGELLPQLYGRADVSLQSDEKGTADAVWTTASNSSRLGVHNSHPLNDALAVIYRLEFEVDFTERRRSTDRGFMRQRNSYLGLKGDWGTAFIGVHDTPFKKAEGKVDLFSNTYVGDINELLGGQNRVSDAVSYITPRLGGVQGWLMLVPGEGEGAESDTADAVTGEGPADGLSASISYKNGPWWLALAADSDIAAQDRYRVVAAYKAGPVRLGALLQRSESVAGGSEDGLGYAISAGFALDSANLLKVQYTSSESDSGEELPGATMTSLGWDHSLAKSTKLYAYFTDISADTAADDRTVFGVGMRHEFGNKK